MTSKQIKITEEPLLAPEAIKLAPNHSYRSVRGSETESDFESHPHWVSHSSPSDRQYRPVSFTPTIPDHRCIENIQAAASIKMNPGQSVNGKQPDSISQNHCTTYYKSVAGKPVHNAIETKNSMQMHERSETSQRTVNMQSMTKITNFQNQLYGEPVPFPYSAKSKEDGVCTKTHLAPPPTPTKFVKGDFRESDYESEVDSGRIRPVWTPIPSDSDDPHYRRVNAPRSSSCPRSNQHQPPASPLEFDTEPPYQPGSRPVAIHSHATENSTDRTAKQHQTITMRHVQTRANEMSDELKFKAQNFMSGFEKTDFGKSMPNSVPQQSNEAQIYRDGSRVSQYGKLAIFHGLKVFDIWFWI